MKRCKDCKRKKPENQFRGTRCKICFAARYYKYPLTGTKTDRIAQAYGKPFPELLAEMRIDRNMKVSDACSELGINKRTYLRYAPSEIKGEPRIEDESDRQRKLFWIEHARNIRLSKLVRKQKPKSDGWSWHKDMSRFFVNVKRK